MQFSLSVFALAAGASALPSLLDTSALTNALAKTSNTTITNVSAGVSYVPSAASSVASAVSSAATSVAAVSSVATSVAAIPSAVSSVAKSVASVSSVAKSVASAAATGANSTAKPIPTTFASVTGAYSHSVPLYTGTAVRIANATSTSSTSVWVQPTLVNDWPYNNTHPALNNTVTGACEGVSCHTGYECHVYSGTAKCVIVGGSQCGSVWCPGNKQCCKSCDKCMSLSLTCNDSTCKTAKPFEP